MPTLALESYESYRFCKRRFSDLVQIDTSVINETFPSVSFPPIPSISSINRSMKRLRVDNINNDCNSYEINSNVSNEPFLPSLVHYSKLEHIDEKLEKKTTTKSSSIPTDESVFVNDERGNNKFHSTILQCPEEDAISMIRKAPSFCSLCVNNENQQSPLHLAVQTNKAKLVRRLICAGAVVDVVDSNGMTPLHLACFLGHVEVVRQLLHPVQYTETIENNYRIPFQRIPQDMSLSDDQGNTCLHLSFARNSREITEMLINASILPDLNPIILDIIRKSPRKESDIFLHPRQDDTNQNNKDQTYLSQQVGS